MYILTCIGVYINIIAKHRTLLASVYQSVLRSVPGVVASRYSGCGLVLLNTAGPGLFSMSLTSPYNQQEFGLMLSSKTHLAKTW